jgi:hypothetical protein
MKQLDVNDVVFDRLNAWIGAEDFDLALGKLLDGAERFGVVPWVRNPGKSARSDYDLPVLAAIRANGGTATVGMVVEEVGRRMKNQFLAGDVQFLPSGGPRWQKEIGFVGMRLAERGLLEKLDKPRGRWRLTETGNAFLGETTGP